MINYQRIKKIKDKHLDEIDMLRVELNTTKEKYENIKQVLEGTLHEVRRFNSEISGYSEKLYRSLSEGNSNGVNLTEAANTIFYTSGMLSARLAFADLELNPAGVANQALLSSGIYKKFEKSKHILTSKARAKHIQFQFNGASFYTQDLMQAFELVPFVIFENAIKYSPNNEGVSVDFDESIAGTLLVKVASIGPTVDSSEISKLTIRGARGANAVKSGVAGDGLGLFLVNFLCTLNNVELRLHSEQSVKYSVANIPYSKFTVTLLFRR